MQGNAVCQLQYFCTYEPHRSDRAGTVSCMPFPQRHSAWSECLSSNATLFQQAVHSRTLLAGTNYGNT